MYTVADNLGHARLCGLGLLPVPNILTRTYDVAGLTLLIQMIPSDSNNQAIISVFGN